MHSKSFYKVKEWFDLGVWDKARVYNAMLKGWITENEYKEIIGE